MKYEKRERKIVKRKDKYAIKNPDNPPVKKPQEFKIVNAFHPDEKVPKHVEDSIRKMASRDPNFVKDWWMPYVNKIISVSPYILVMVVLIILVAVS